MQIQKLKANCFRLFSEKNLDFLPGLNFIIGENAKGKTTLLEALYLLMAGKSFRTHNFTDLVQKEASFFKIEAYFEKWGVSQSLKMTMQENERYLCYNSSKLNTLSGLLGILQGVLITPHDLELIKGSPGIRRHYLDLQIAQTDPLYVHHFMRYAKGLKVRNSQLRSRNLHAIDVFEEMIAEAASYIMEKREAAVSGLNPYVNDYYHQISGKNEPIHLLYAPSLKSSSKESILDQLKIARKKDMELGFSRIGPHKDDLNLLISGNFAKSFASEGEMRSLILALKLAEWKHMKGSIHICPLLFVDEIGISLDSLRFENLINIFSTLGQVIITSAMNENLFPSSGCNIISLK